MTNDLRHPDRPRRPAILERMPVNMTLDEIRNLPKTKADYEAAMVAYKAAVAVYNEAREKESNEAQGKESDELRRRWDRAFIRQALEWAVMSKDPNTQVGAIIIGPDREIRSSGFNGFPRGIIDTPDRLNNRDLKLRLIVHAERNALCNAARIGTPLKGCTLYLAATDSSGLIWGGPPCTACTIELIQCGIIEIVSLPKKSVPSRWHDDLEMAESLLSEAGIAYREISDGAGKQDNEKEIEAELKLRPFSHAPDDERYSQ